MDHDKRWNAAIEIMQEILMDNPEGRYRGQVRTEGCCNELKKVRESLLSHLSSMKR